MYQRERPGATSSLKPSGLPFPRDLLERLRQHTSDPRPAAGAKRSFKSCFWGHLTQSRFSTKLAPQTNRLDGPLQASSGNNWVDDLEQLFTEDKREMSPQGFPRGPVVKNLPSNAGGVGSITSQGAEIPCINKATKPVHHNRDPAQPKKLKSNEYTNIFSNTRHEESEPHSENPGRTYTQGHLLNHQGRQLGSLCVSEKNRHHELKHNQCVKVCELLMKLRN